MAGEQIASAGGTDMQLVFLYGPPASGKLTIAKALAVRSGLALFHNHLVVDVVTAIFPFGSPEFIRLREQFWLDSFQAAARAGRSLIFTFCPEASVAPDFPAKVAKIVEDAGGRVLLVALTVDAVIQEQRLAHADRAAFGKLRSVDLLRQLRDNFERCMAAMPAAALTIDTTAIDPDGAASEILALMQRAA
jgi:hypothetical protein